MIVSDSGNHVDFAPAPEGNHVARCVSVIDLGTQESEYAGQKTLKRQLFFIFELPNEMKTYTNADGDEITEPFTVTKFYTASLNEKANLRKDLESWRGRAFTEDELSGFDIKNVIGAPCMVNVVHKAKNNGQVNANIVSVNALPKGLTCPDQHNETLFFDLDNYNDDTFEKVSKGLRGMIEKSPEYQSLSAPPPNTAAVNHANAFTDDVPF